MKGEKTVARVRRDIDSRFRDMTQRELTDYIHKMGNPIQPVVLDEAGRNPGRILK